MKLDRTDKIVAAIGIGTLLLLAAVLTAGALAEASVCKAYFSEIPTWKCVLSSKLKVLR